MFGTWEGCFVCLFVSIVCLFVVFFFPVLYFCIYPPMEKIFDLLNQKK